MSEKRYLGSVNELWLDELRCTLPGENEDPLSVSESVDAVVTAMFFTAELASNLRGLTPDTFLDDEFADVCQRVMAFMDREMNAHAIRIKLRGN